MERLVRGSYIKKNLGAAGETGVEKSLSIPEAVRRLSMKPKTLANRAGVLGAHN